MKELQNRFAQYLMNIQEVIRLKRLKPKPVDATVEKQDTQALVDPVVTTKFGVLTVAGRYEIIKKPDDFLG